MLSGQDCFEKYLSLKLHFTDPKYDFFKYNGKIATSKAYGNRRDTYTFEKIARKYGQGLIVPFFVANFIKNTGFYVGDDGSDQVFRDWKARVDMVNRTIQEDFVLIHDFMDSRELSFDKLYEIQEEGKFPVLFRFHLSSMIQPETAMLLLNGLRLFDRWQGALITDQAIYKAEALKLKRYAPFFDLPQLMKKNQEAIAKLFKSRTG